MTDYDFRSVFPILGGEPIPGLTDVDLTLCDSQSILCIGPEFVRLAPFAPCQECDFEGKQAFITSGYFMRFILLDLVRVFDHAVLRSAWARTGIEPEVWSRMLRVASRNGLRPATSPGELLLSLINSFDGLDNCSERILTADDLILYEAVDENTDWLSDSQWIEEQTFGDFLDPATGSISPLGFISSSGGDFMDPAIRGMDRSLFASLACVWADVANLNDNLDPKVLSGFAAEAVKTVSWPIGFTGPWDPTSSRVIEFDTWVRYVTKQELGRLNKRFKAYIQFEAQRFPQLSLLAEKSMQNEDFWDAIRLLLTSYFPTDVMSIDSWSRLEFTMANPNLLLFTSSPEHKAKDLAEWVQYILHQRTEANLLVKQSRVAVGSETQNLTSGSEYAEFHNTTEFLEFVSHLRTVINQPDATTFRIQCAVLLSGLSVVTRWMIGMPLNLTGHDIYKELMPHKMPGGKHLLSDFSEFVGRVVVDFTNLHLPLKDVVKYRFPEWALTNLFAGEMFDFFEVLDDLNFQMSKTEYPGLSADESWRNRERLEQVEQLFTPVLELFGCGDEKKDMSFADLINKARARLSILKPLKSASDPQVYNSFMDNKPYGIMCWLNSGITLGLQQISRRFKNNSPALNNEQCFIPITHTQIRQSYEMSEETVKSKLQEHLIVGEFPADSHCQYRVVSTRSAASWRNILFTVDCLRMLKVQLWDDPTADRVTPTSKLLLFRHSNALRVSRLDSN